MAEEENMPRKEISEEVPQSEPAPETEQVPEGEAPEAEGAEGAQTPAEDVSSEDEEASERSSNRKKVIIGVSVVVALIVIFIIILLLLLGSCTHRHSMEHVDGVGATCETPGVIDHWHCDECDKDYLDEDGKELITDIVIPAYGHVLATIEGEPPTCTEPGLTEGKRCVSCNEIVEEQEEIPALGHAYREGEDKVIQEPTCTEPGVKEYVCMRCGEEQKEAIPALGHAEPVIKGRKEPTCTEEGYSGEARCSRCNELLEEGTTIPALGHDWGAPVVTSNPGCIYPGEQVYTCTRCPKTRKETLSALGHNMVDKEDVKPTCETPGMTGERECTRCHYTEGGEVIPPLGHEIVDNECINCGKDACTDLKFEINDPNNAQYYVLIGLGDCEHTHILVPDRHTGAYGKLPVSSVGNYVFAAFDANNEPQDVGQIQTISFPDSITSIGAGAFQSCTNLINVTLGRSLERIGAGAFRGCTNLTSLHFLGSVSDWNARDEGSGYGTSVDGALLSDPETAAELFRDTYSNYSWWRSGSGYGYLFLD